MRYMNYWKIRNRVVIDICKWHNKSKNKRGINMTDKIKGGIRNVLDAKHSNGKALEVALKIRKQVDQAYHEGESIISDMEYDKFADWIGKAGEIQGRDTMKVGATPEVNAPYTKVKHPVRIASLNKSKSAEELAKYFGRLCKGNGKEAVGMVVIMPKLDGLTLVLKYEGGVFKQAVTRGDGEVGEDVTHTVMGIKNIPHKLSHPSLMGTVYVRGEAVITKKNFEPHAQEFKNPRNLVAGVIRTKDIVKASKVKVDFILFDCLNSATKEFEQGKGLASIFKNSFFEMLSVFWEEGFKVVERGIFYPNVLPEMLGYIAEGVADYPICLDGAVVRVDDYRLARVQDTSGKERISNPKSAMAFKWADNEYKTRVTGVIWSPARTGTITPVITLEPVDIEGSTVKQASVHNISIMRDLELGVGDVVSVYKANMIIPQISENHTRSNNIEIPKTCPVCGGDTQIKKTDRTVILVCGNADCDVRTTKALAHFSNILDIQGLGGKTIEALAGTTPPILTDFASIYKLESQEKRCREEAGLGAKVYSNLVSSINNTRGAKLDKVLTALGIHGLGQSTAQRICKYINNNPKDFLELRYDELVKLADIGPKTAEGIANYIIKHNGRILGVLNEIYRDGIKVEPSLAGDGKLKGYTFVITGPLWGFQKREQLEQVIKENGGIVVSTVKSNVSYLINNDRDSKSSKSKKAMELGIPVINEYGLLLMIGKAKV
jgi:DNA ligase (NAD+)